ncbi:uncharacterized protein K460DRAFT_38631 [Cucurbitaria berberidis CBS 394.84]|uniref:Uncharacterized protein n=1 Tax=Cucurbitaria berberidis CBS 394.84 TaxID=1168544 RepID=A0A9P4GUM2_9PLEO|nr:uncharacterized protein K460DRAFT_38631 [Cucurbitaria berberidis CBS 394.84]KAF1851622.1 hypothetical protein K460DRAFT_38631 [Cucurbitaria berberidis CBS 394.84]
MRIRCVTSPNLRNPSSYINASRCQPLLPLTCYPNFPTHNSTPNRTMQFLYSLLATFAFSFAYAKPCSTSTTTPTTCDYDQWHQERKVLLGPSARINVQCWAPGRSVMGNNRWFYVNDRECWVNSNVFGPRCNGMSTFRYDGI